MRRLIWLTATLVLLALLAWLGWSAFGEPAAVEPESSMPADASMGAAAEPLPGAATAERQEVPGAAPKSAGSSPATLPTSQPLPELAGGRGGLRIRVMRDDAPATRHLVRVQLTAPEASWGPSRDVYTDEQGEARVVGLRPGHYQVRAYPGSWRWARVSVGRWRDVTLVLSGGFVVQGQVEVQGQALQGAQILLTQDSRPENPAVVAWSDAKGRFRLVNVQGKPWVSAWHAGHRACRQHRLSGKPGEAVSVILRLGGSVGAVSGRVVDSQGPVVGAAVRIGKAISYDRRREDGGWVPGPAARIVHTDKEGRFACQGIAVGEHPLLVYSAEHARFERVVAVAEARDTIVDVFLQRGATVAGVVRDAADKPAAGVRVSYESPHAFGARWVVSDRDGKFRLAGLPTGRKLWLSAYRAKPAGTADTILTLLSGQQAEWNPVLGSKSVAKVVYNGVLLSHQGKPLARWMVRATAVGSDLAEVAPQYVETSPLGEFRLDAKKHKAFKLHLQPRAQFRDFPYHIVDSVRFSAGSQNHRQVIRVPDPALANATVRAVLVDAAGKPVAGVMNIQHKDALAWRQFKSHPTTGAFEVFPVPPGRLRIKLQSTGHPWKKLAEQRAVAGMVLDLGQVQIAGPAGVLHGALRMSNGSAVGKATVRLTRSDGEEAAVVTVRGAKFRSGPVPVDQVYQLSVQGEGIAAETRAVRVTTVGEQRQDLTLQPGFTRRLRFVFAKGMAPPNFISVVVHREPPKGKGPWQMVWRASIERRTGLRADVCLGTGTYMVGAYAGTALQAQERIQIQTHSPSDQQLPMIFQRVKK